MNERGKEGNPEAAASSVQVPRTSRKMHEPAEHAGKGNDIILLKTARAVKRLKETGVNPKKKDPPFGGDPQIAKTI